MLNKTVAKSISFLGLFFSSTMVFASVTTVHMTNNCSKTINYLSDWGNNATINSGSTQDVQMDNTYFFNISIADPNTNIQCNFVPTNDYTGVQRNSAGSDYCNDQISVTVPAQYYFNVTCSLQDKLE